MRLLLIAVAVSALLSLPASATGLDPTALVIRQADVPAGFRLDRDESGVRSNELEAKEYPETRTLFARWGRITGYQAAYMRNAKTIEARADVFRGAYGARMLLAWTEREMRKAGVKGLRRAPTDLGAEGWVHWAPSPLNFALVVWRDGRVFAGVMGLGIGRDLTLGLARVQQSRIAAALG